MIHSFLAIQLVYILEKNHKLNDYVGSILICDHGNMFLDSPGHTKQFFFGFCDHYFTTTLMSYKPISLKVNRKALHNEKLKDSKKTFPWLVT